MLYGAGPVCRIDGVEVPFQDLRYGGLALLAIPHEGLRWTHRLRQRGKRRQINTESEKLVNFVNTTAEGGMQRFAPLDDTTVLPVILSFQARKI